MSDNRIFTFQNHVRLPCAILLKKMFVVTQVSLKVMSTKLIRQKSYLIAGHIQQPTDLSKGLCLSPVNMEIGERSKLNHLKVCRLKSLVSGCVGTDRTFFLPAGYVV